MKKLAKFSAFMVAAMFAATSFTSCGDDDPVDILGVDEVIDVANFKIKANSDGTITFFGDVSSNAKIKKFELQDASGNVVYDFTEENPQVKEKLKNIAEDGKVTKEKVFSMTNIDSKKIPVDFYTLVIKTKKASTEAKLGEEFKYTIGASGSSTGSYLSVLDNKQYTMDQAKTTKTEVIAVSSSDGKTVLGLKAASKANNADVAAKAGKVALFQNGVQANEVKEGGVIITESGCIVKINQFNNTSTGDATFDAILIKSTSGLTVDVAGYTFSK
ncbi:MAG: hypothetical protein J6Z01_11470 [Bacteroidales bacterium]|nr:hypothetical protein [Bacteroidales bacterium]